MIMVIKKRTIVILTAIVLITVVTSALLITQLVLPASAAPKKLPIYYVDSTENKVALSFDAAWGADKTEQILDILDQYEYKATFFLVGFWIDEYPEMVSEIHERGHLIGNHSTNHLHMSKINQSKLEEEISITSQKIKEITGYDPAYFRAPFGEYDNKMIEYSEKANFQVVQWDVDTLDWKGISGKEIAERTLHKAKDGSIILCHNNSDHILDALPLMLIGLKNKGLTPVRMDELVLKENYYIASDGKQIKNS